MTKNNLVASVRPRGRKNYGRAVVRYSKAMVVLLTENDEHTDNTSDGCNN